MCAADCTPSFGLHPFIDVAPGYPFIGRGGVEEYPYDMSLERVRYLYNECGPRALVWGSDMPNILRHCTYRQSLDYLRRHATFIHS